jgi:exopolysaccharide biosynthesis polyprenyl glycosylphosphotransferase
MAAPDFVAQNLYAEAIAPPREERRAISRAFFKATMTLAEASADFLAAALGLLAACSLCASLPIGATSSPSAHEAVAVGIVFGLLVIVLMHRDGGYHGGSGLLRIRETERAIRIPAQSLLLLFAISVLVGLGFSWFVLFVGAVAVPAFLIVEKQIVFAIAGRLHRSENGMSRAVVYGAGDTGKRVVSTLLHSPRLGFQPVLVIDDNLARSGGRILAMGYRGRGSVPVRPGPVTPALLNLCRADLLLLATQNLSRDELAAATYAASQAGLDVALFAGPPLAEHRTESIDIDGLLFTSTIERPIAWHYAVLKRIMDRALSSLLLVLLAPILFLIAILIRLDSPGPALFVQKRVGRNGELFDIFKFRSMVVDAPKYSLSPTSSSDPRITRIGRFLRRMNLDELPQLLNVFAGTMSLVGPRPEMPFVVERYNERHRERLQVTPGITGLWQLSADRAFPIHQNIEYDLYYIRNRSFVMDAAILVHTLLFAIAGGI